MYFKTFKCIYVCGHTHATAYTHLNMLNILFNDTNWSIKISTRISPYINT